MTIHRTAVRALGRVLGAVLLVAAAATGGHAEQGLDFLTPAPGVPFFVVKAGAAQNIQVCATKAFLDQLVLWPGAPIVVDLTWQPMSPPAWPKPDTLPRKAQLVMWLPGNTKFCSGSVLAKHEDFPHTGGWQLAVSMQGTPKKLGMGTYTLGGGTRTIRVDPPTYKPLPPGSVKAAPGPIVAPPAAGGGQSGTGGRLPATGTR
jgi:hypothetical protein